MNAIVDCRITDFSSLKEKIRDLERAHLLSQEERPALRFGLPAIDRELPAGGLAQGGLHEVQGNVGEAAAIGFAAAFAAGAQALRKSASVLWCRLDRESQEQGELYPPGLLHFDLRAERLLLVKVRRKAELFWAMEEGLRCRHLAAVVGEGAASDLVSSRRLQLAAAEGGGAGFLILPAARPPVPSAALTRWHVSVQPTPEMAARLRWRIDLRRVRGGRPGSWLVEWNDAAFRFDLVAALADRSLAPATA